MAEMLQILAPDGTLVGESPVDDKVLSELYEAMVTARSYDHKATALQRQGRLATYAPYEGQEAAQIGAVAMLETRDWLVASYRDAAAMQRCGYPWTQLLLTRTGDERGGQPPDGVNVLPPSITVGAHMIHAVGIAWAQRLNETGAVAMTMFGDIALSSERIRRCDVGRRFSRGDELRRCVSDSDDLRLPEQRLGHLDAAP